MVFSKNEIKEWIFIALFLIVLEIALRVLNHERNVVDLVKSGILILLKFSLGYVVFKILSKKLQSEKSHRKNIH